MKYKIILIAVFLIYIISITIFMVVKGIGITPDRFIPLFILPSFFIRKTRRFLFDFLPLLFILLSYEYLRGLASITNPSVHYFNQINIDLFLFHALPTNIFQSWFYQPDTLHWYDFFFTIVYFVHFATPLIFGYILWILNRKRFGEFVTGLSILSYSGWITYLLYPSAPPWLASNMHYIPHVTKIMDSTLSAFPQQINLPTVYQNFDPNQVAAIPSLHAAFPFLIFLFGYRFFGKKMLPMLGWTLLVCFVLVYLGEHYVSDCLAGIAYATIAYLLTVKVFYNPNFYLWLNRINTYKIFKLKIKKISKKLLGKRKLPAFLAED